MIKKLLVTGCAGFIGSNFVRFTLDTYPNCRVVGLDKLTYAGNTENLESFLSDARFDFIVGDIGDRELVSAAIADVDAVVNFAADSMVDRAVLDPEPFLKTNFVSVNTLLDLANRAGVKRFLQISTQEVYGQVPEHAAPEIQPLQPRNIYAACKAGAEMLASAYSQSFGLPVVFTRGSNAIGRNQHPEKVTPLFITNAIEGKELPIYGDGSSVRDYIHVDDLNAANDLVLRYGELGCAYNVVSGEERSLLELATTILDLLGKSHNLIRLVGDRPGHDYRYYLNANRIMDLGWKPRHSLKETIRATVEWYVENQDWWRKTKQTDQFQEYYKSNYEDKFSLK